MTDWLDREYEDVSILGLRFNLTSIACPEQYDVFDRDDRQVGYVRLRHGRLTVDCTGCQDENVMTVQYGTGDEGLFDTDEDRRVMLAAAACMIDRHARAVPRE